MKFTKNILSVFEMHSVRNLFFLYKHEILESSVLQTSVAAVTSGLRVQTSLGWADCWEMAVLQVRTDPAMQSAAVRWEVQTSQTSAGDSKRFAFCRASVPFAEAPAFIAEAEEGFLWLHLPLVTSSFGLPFKDIIFTLNWLVSLKLDIKLHIKLYGSKFY